MLPPMVFLWFPRASHLFLTPVEFADGVPGSPWLADLARRVAAAADGKPGRGGGRRW